VADSVSQAHGGCVQQMIRRFGAVDRATAPDARRVSWTTQTRLTSQAEGAAA